jgi:hypothetical protein
LGVCMPPRDSHAALVRTVLTLPSPPLPSSLLLEITQPGRRPFHGEPPFPGMPVPHPGLGPIPVPGGLGYGGRPGGLVPDFDGDLQVRMVDRRGLSCKPGRRDVSGARQVDLIPPCVAWSVVCGRQPGGGFMGPGGGNLMGPNHPLFSGQGPQGMFPGQGGYGMPAPRFDPYGPVRGWKRHA